MPRVPKPKRKRSGVSRDGSVADGVSPKVLPKVLKVSPVPDVSWEERVGYRTTSTKPGFTVLPNVMRSDEDYLQLLVTLSRQGWRPGDGNPIRQWGAYAGALGVHQVLVHPVARLSELHRAGYIEKKTGEFVVSAKGRGFIRPKSYPPVLLFAENGRLDWERMVRAGLRRVQERKLLEARRHGLWTPQWYKRWRWDYKRWRWMRQWMCRWKWKCFTNK